MTLPLDSIIAVDVTRSTRTASRRSFGVAMIVAFHTAWLDLSRSYSDPSEMLEDGFEEHEAAYKAAVRLVSQSPRSPTFKIGRRAGAPEQSFRLTPSTPVAGEVFSFGYGGVVFSVTADASPTIAEIVAALVALTAADPDSIIASGAASAVTAQTLDAADFNGVIGDDEIAPPRNLTITLNSHADWDVSTIVVTGKAPSGRTITENFAVPNGGAVTLTGTKVFKSVTTVLIPAQTGTNGTLTMGTGIVFDNAELVFTATNGSTYVDVAADNPGDWFELTDVTANLAIEDRTAEPAPTLAADLTAIKAADADFYGLIIADAQSSAQILAASAWAETEVVLYVPHTLDTVVTEDTDTDVLSDLQAASALRAKGVYSRVNHGSFPDAAVLGMYLPRFSQGPRVPALDYKALNGIVADDLSTTIIERLTGTPSSPNSGKNATVYVEVLPTGTNRGTPVTWGSLTAGDEWVDVVMGIDFMTSLIQERLFNLQLNSPAIPYTETGADALAGAVRGALIVCARAPYQFLEEETILVEHTPVDEIDPGVRQTRFYDGITFDVRAQGAMRGLRIRGNVRP